MTNDTSLPKNQFRALSSKRTSKWLSRLPVYAFVAAAFASGIASLPAPAQSAAPAQGAIVNTPIPEMDVPATAKRLFLVESPQTAKEMVKGWKKPTKVIVRVDNNSNRLAWLQKAVPGVEVIAVRNAKEAMAAISDADAILGFCASDEMLKAGKNIKWMHSSAAGVEECINGTELQSGRILVSNSHHNSFTLADHAIAMMMALSRGLDLYSQMKLSGKLDQRAVPTERLWQIQGRTMLVVGLGGIGNQVAEIAHNLGMKVIATRNSSREGPAYVDYVGLADETPKLIGQADVVVVCTPLTKETEGMYNAAMFARMQKGAFFINIARGKEVVIEDLIAALKSGQVGGAGLDGMEPELIADGAPIFSAPNVIVTGHMAGRAIGHGPGDEISWMVLRENLRRYAAGDKLYSVVDVKQGY